jgi:NAD(P)-dependent dehydrogenase (short-subunit alcohol dehydrogenase family)
MRYVADDLQGKVVAIAGAGGSLGPIVSSLLASRGAKLALAERHPEIAEKCAADLGVGEDQCDTFAVDLLDPDAARQWAERAASKFGGVDALVHLVGGWRGGKPIAEAPVEDDEFLHALLVKSVQTATRAFLPHLTERAGRFVIVSSIQAQSPTATNAAYATAKAGAEAWTLAFADELSSHGGTANVIVVNAIVTPKMREENPDKSYDTFTDASQIAEAIVFLLGEGGSKMNGQRLSLHG